MPAPILEPYAENLAEAARLLHAGRLVALPTETVYGLAGDATNIEAVSAIYHAKKRPPTNPLIVHVANTALARELVTFDRRAEQLAEAFWPGPLTLVLQRSDSCPVVHEVSAGLATIAIRVPDHTVAIDALEIFRGPMAAPSANPSAGVSPTTAQHVADSMGDNIAAIIDGGPCRIGVESTVIGLFESRAELLRPGAAARSEIERLIGRLSEPGSGDSNAPQASPGRLARHYAPSRPLRLDSTEVASDEALLAFGAGAPTGAALCCNLSINGNVTEAARNLFAMLRKLDRPEFKAIAVMPIPDIGLGVAINDRLAASSNERLRVLADDPGKVYIGIMTQTLDPAIAAKLKQVVGPRGWIESEAGIAPFLDEQRGYFHGNTPLLLRPASVDEVAAIVRICARSATPVVPQGGNTGLVGGAVPHEDGTEILVNLSRMNAIRAIDTFNNTMEVEAGCILADIQNAAAEADRLFPLSLAAEGTCQIGGNLSTNAGGTNVLRYGNARSQVLGLEVVLPDGQIWNGLRALRKDNTGYDLKHLFIGAEGTLGIITAAVLTLFPRPREITTAMIAARDPAAAVELLVTVQSATANAATAWELMPRCGIDLTLKNIPGTVDPFASEHDWYILAELSGGATDGQQRAALENALAAALDAGTVEDAVIASSAAQAASLWRIRETMPEAQRIAGGGIRHDVAVPLSHIAGFIDTASENVRAAVADVGIVAYGHLGDGNIHFNLSLGNSEENKVSTARRNELMEIVHNTAVELGGTISAEHGIGRLKRDQIARYKSETELNVMRVVKAALDPQGIMNPGKVI